MVADAVTNGKADQKMSLQLNQQTVGVERVCLVRCKATGVVLTRGTFRGTLKILRNGRKRFAGPTERGRRLVMMVLMNLDSVHVISFCL